MSRPTTLPAGALSVRLRRSVVISAVLLFLAMAVTTLATAAPSTAHAATLSIAQCNGDETGAAREIRCDVSVVNTLDVATGVTGSTVSTTVCTGAPGEATCVTTPSASTDIIGSVTQCNDSANAGGSIVTCNVDVINNITGVGSTQPATLNQCIGSGGGGGTEPTTNCSPLGSTTNADVTQCNGSGNGGGATLRVTCTMSTSTISALFPVTINQCNGSANGGGDLVTCTARITTNLLAPAATTTVATTTTTVATTVTTAPGGGTATTAPGGGTATTVAAGGTATTAPTAGPTTAPAATSVPGRRLPDTGGTMTGLLAASILSLAGIGALLASRRRTA